MPGPRAGGAGARLWARATYFGGTMAAYRLTGEPRYLAYAESWAEKHDYGLAGGVATRHADSHNAGQVYLDIHAVRGGEERIAAIEASLHRMVHTDRPEKDDDWWWVDALHMAMPPMARLGALRGDSAYWAKMYALYDHTKRVRGGGLAAQHQHLAPAVRAPAITRSSAPHSPRRPRSAGSPRGPRDPRRGAPPAIHHHHAVQGSTRSAQAALIMHQLAWTNKQCASSLVGEAR
ncbi:glycoside hydrolase family 88 protein [Kitasatospora sp. NPDC028055]|uniref:glycoside hydrolase family 88 protein n=1 Tax=Kitasatospora sp. NPDC028055 TaxID=3155653 RepID=UPI0033C31ACF